MKSKTWLLGVLCALTAVGFVACGTNGSGSSDGDVGSSGSGNSSSSSSSGNQEGDQHPDFVEAATLEEAVAALETDGYTTQLVTAEQMGAHAPAGCVGTVVGQKQNGSKVEIVQAMLFDTEANATAYMAVIAEQTTGDLFVQSGCWVYAQELEGAQPDDPDDVTAADVFLVATTLQEARDLLETYGYTVGVRNEGDNGIDGSAGFLEAHKESGTSATIIQAMYFDSEQSAVAYMSTLEDEDVETMGFEQIGRWVYFEVTERLEGDPDDDIVGVAYELINDGAAYEVVGFGGDETEVVIPATYNDLPVVSIGANAFFACDTLVSVEIPDSITTIKEYAFHTCTSLTEITVGEGNANYKSVDGNLYSKDGTKLIQYAVGKTATEFTVPDGVTAIEKSACYSCDNLISVEIPDSITTIKERAFYACKKMESITFGESSQLTTIEQDAFRLSGLTRIDIPDSVKVIGLGAFNDCEKLAEVNFGDDTQLTSIRRGTFDNCFALEYNVHEGGRYFGNDTNPYLVLMEVWYWQNDDTTYTVPDSTKVVAGYAFQYCDFTTVIFGENSQVTTIGLYAFQHCSTLTSVIFGKNSQLTSIGAYAFEGSENLTSIVIPKTVKNVAYAIFKDCTKLEAVYCLGTVADWTHINNSEGNGPLMNAKKYYYSETQPAQAETYWHYVNGVPTVWEV